MTSSHALPQSLLLACLVTIAACSPAAKTADTTVAQAGSPADRHPGVAKNLVAAALISAGDRVLIAGSVRDVALLEDLAIETAKLGGQPMITISSDALTRRSYDEVPAQFDSATPKLGMAIASSFDAMFSIDIRESDSVLAGVPAARLQARAKAGLPVSQASLKRGVRSVSLGNDIYPTAQAAKLFGMPQAALAEAFWKAVAVPAETIRTKGEAVRAAIAAGKSVTVSASNGTNVTFAIDAAKAFVSDGALSAAGVKKGGAAALTWLPAGELLIPLALGTADGKVVVDKYYYNGTLITGLTLTFVKGKVTAMTAASGLEPLKAAYDAAGGGKDQLSYLDLGLNPEVKLPLTSGRVVWMGAGAVTLGIGDNTGWAGSNASDFGLPLVVSGATVSVDGKPIVEAGVLK